MEGKEEKEGRWKGMGEVRLMASVAGRYSGRVGRKILRKREVGRGGGVKGGGEEKYCSYESSNILVMNIQIFIPEIVYLAVLKPYICNENIQKFC